MDFSDYFAKHGMTPNSGLVDFFNALRVHFTERHAALDLGAGNGRDALWLKHGAGFEKVVAVDLCEEITSFGQTHPEIECHQMRIEGFVPLERDFNLCLCLNTLWYMSKEDTVATIQKIYQALRPGGILICNLMGPKDAYVSIQPQPWMSHWQNERYVRKLFSRYFVIESEECYRLVPGKKGELSRPVHSWTVVAKKIVK